MKTILAIIAAGFCTLTVAGQNWPEGRAPSVAAADPYVAIPGAALAPTSSSTYKAVFDATRMSADPKTILPGVNAVGGLLNDLSVGGTPYGQAHFVIVFHGPATDGILDNAHYHEKYGVDNPNLPVLAAMRKFGVELFVCGQHLAANKIDPRTLSTDVKIAADAYLVLINYQDRGYASMWF